MLGRRRRRFDSREVTLYRGDGRRPEVIFATGFRAADPSMPIREHCGGGSGRVSTSRSDAVARGFAVAGAAHRGFGAVYRIVGAPAGTPVDYRAEHLMTHAGEAEVVFDRVEPNAIPDATSHDWRLAWRNAGGAAVPAP